MALLYLICHLGLFVVVLVFALLFELTKTQGFVKLEQALGTINELAIRDELTGVHNRRYLLSLIEKEKERSDRNGRAFCLCLLDIDFFKRINDTWGHAAGDTVLRAFAGIGPGQGARQRQLRALRRRGIPADAARNPVGRRHGAGRARARRDREDALPGRRQRDRADGVDRRGRIPHAARRSG